MTSYFIFFLLYLVLQEPELLEPLEPVTLEQSTSEASASHFFDMANPRYYLPLKASALLPADCVTAVTLKKNTLLAHIQQDLHYNFLPEECYSAWIARACTLHLYATQPDKALQG